MIDRASIADIVGPVAITEFDTAADRYKPGLVAWARTLPTLTDEQFLDECAHAVYNAALAVRLQGNWDHEHFKASACHYDADRRYSVAGHSTGCRASTLYVQAHAAAMRSAGHTPPRLIACTCEAQAPNDPTTDAKESAP